MENEIKVSIIIPVYNAEKHINKCIDTILKQTYKNYEIIIINDGSTDNSNKIILEYKNKFPNKIKYIEQKNHGVAKTRNSAIKLAKGKYLIFIDNDDFIDEDYVMTLVENIERDNLDVVISGYRRKNEKNEIVKEMKLKNEEWSKLMVMAPWAKIYKTSYLIKNNIEFLDNNIGEDVFFNMQAMLLTKKIKILDYIGYNWFFNTESVSNTVQKDIRKLDIYKLLNKTYQVLKDKQILSNKYDLVEMYFIRYSIWIMTFSTKKLSYNVISKEYDNLFDWLEERFPKYKKTKMIGINKPKGEIKVLQIEYVLFMFFHKIGLGKLLIWIYSKI